MFLSPSSWAELVKRVCTAQVDNIQGRHNGLQQRGAPNNGHNGNVKMS